MIHISQSGVHFSPLLLWKATEFKLDSSDQEKVQNFIDALYLTNFAIALNPLRLCCLHRDYILDGHFLLNGPKVSVEISDAFWDKALEELLWVHLLPLFELLVEGLWIFFVLAFFFFITTATKVKVILLEWLRHINEDASESWIDLCLEVRDENWVDFLKELAAHFLSVLL